MAFYAWHPPSRMLVLLLDYNAHGQPTKAVAISMQAVNALDPNATEAGLAAGLPVFELPADKPRVHLAGPGDAIAAALGRQSAQREAQLLRDAQREVRRGRSH